MAAFQRLFNRLVGIGGGMFLAGVAGQSALYNGLCYCGEFAQDRFAVDGGERAVIFDRFSGVKPNVVGEGTHFIIPMIQKPIIFDIRSTPRPVTVTTGSKGTFGTNLLA